MPPKATPSSSTANTAPAAAITPTAPAASLNAALKANSRRLDKSEKNVLVHLLQAPKLTNGDIAKIIDVDERTISRRRKQLRTLGHLSPERNVKGAEKLRPWHLEKIISLLDENEDYQLKDVQDFLVREHDLHVTVSTISRQLSRAGHARARRPGYKNTRPDLQAEALAQAQQQQPDAQMQDAQGFIAPDQQQLPLPAAGQTQGAGYASSAARAEPQFACPFFKADPQQYMNSPFCQSGWPSVRDVKEHIYRQHMQPKNRCNRCMEVFENNNALVFHQRLSEPCLLAEWSSAEGCDEEQKERIRKGDKGDENTRWKRMFRILFPDVENPPDGTVYANAYYPAPAACDPNLAAWNGGQAPRVPRDV